MHLSDVRSDSFSYKGCCFHYKIVGEGKPVLFLHGNGMDMRMWQPQIEALGDNMKMILMDMRGFGASEVTELVPFSFWEDAVALLKHLELETVDVVGMSLGGAVAMDMAVQKPEMVSSLVLIDAGVSGYPDKLSFPVKLKPVMELAQENNLDEAKSRWLEQDFFAVSKRDTKVFGAIQQMVDSFSGFYWQHGDLEQKMEPRSGRRLAELDMPTLVLVGEHDLRDFRVMSEYIAEQIDDAVLQVIASAGHVSTMDQPEQVNAILRDFLLKK